MDAFAQEAAEKMGDLGLGPTGDIAKRDELKAQLHTRHLMLRMMQLHIDNLILFTEKFILKTENQLIEGMSLSQQIEILQNAVLLGDTLLSNTVVVLHKLQQQQ